MHHFKFIFILSRNGSNFVFKLAAWLFSGSHSMFSESIHSLADTINQLILAFGIHKSVQVCNLKVFLSTSFTSDLTRVLLFPFRVLMRSTLMATLI